MLHFVGHSAMVSLRKYHEPKYRCADIMRALAEILSKAHVTDGQAQYCIELYNLFHLRGIWCTRVADPTFGCGRKNLVGAVGYFKI